MMHITTNPMITMKDGAVLHVRDAGEGEPLFLLHGLTGTGSDWVHVFEPADLAGYRVIAPDARGHGRSDDPKGAFTFRRCALDVVELLDHLGIAKASAVGVSLGAKTLLHVATIAPDRISSMVLVSATPRFPDTTRALFRAAAAASHSREEWDAMRALHVRGDEQLAALWRLPARFADDEADMSFTSSALARVTARTLVVAGDRDPLYPVELAVELYRAIPGASLYVVPGGAHGPIFGAERAGFVARAEAHLRASPGG
jgi:pimeloyl-ACP methyl ester carboxylesterase